MAKNSVPDPQSIAATQEGTAKREPEDRAAGPRPEKIRDKMLDKTLADTFPTSDPPSSIPDPCAEDSFGDDKVA